MPTAQAGLTGIFGRGRERLREPGLVLHRPEERLDGQAGRERAEHYLLAAGGHVVPRAGQPPGEVDERQKADVGVAARLASQATGELEGYEVGAHQDDDRRQRPPLPGGADVAEQPSRQGRLGRRKVERVLWSFGRHIYR